MHEPIEISFLFLILDFATIKSTFRLKLKIFEQTGIEHVSAGTPSFSKIPRAHNKK